MHRNLRTLQAREEQQNHFSILGICERIQSFTLSVLKGCPPGLDPPPWCPRLPESPPSGWTVRLGPSWEESSGPGTATACAGGSSAASSPSTPDPPCARSSSPGRSHPKVRGHSGGFVIRGAAVVKLNTCVKLGTVCIVITPMDGLITFACWRFMEFNCLESGSLWNSN